MAVAPDYSRKIWLTPHFHAIPQHPLRPNGERVAVTPANVLQYVYLMADYKLNSGTSGGGGGGGGGSGGGTMVERWWNNGGTIVEQWWNNGGTMVEVAREMMSTFNMMTLPASHRLSTPFPRPSPALPPPHPRSDRHPGGGLCAWLRAGGQPIVDHLL